MNGTRHAFLLIGLGTPLFGFLDWLMLRLTAGPLVLHDWRYLVFWVAAYPTLAGLLYAFMVPTDSDQRSQGEARKSHDLL